MQVSITIEQEDFINGETLPEVLSRFFGVAEEIPVPSAAVGGTPQSEPVPPEKATNVLAQPGGYDEHEALTPPPDTPSSAPEVETHGTDFASRITGVELDAEGVSWAPEIHSSGKTQYKSGAQAGRWIRRKGIPDELYATTTADLKALHAGSAPAVAQTAPAVAQATAYTAGARVAAPWTIPVFLQKVSAAQTNNGLTKERIAEVLAAYEVPNMPHLATAAHMGKMGGIAADLGLA